MMLQRISDLQPHNQTNTRINKCAGCELTVTETWIKPVTRWLECMGMRKEFTVEMGRWETELENGRCKKCKKREDEENEKKETEKAVQEAIEKGIKVVGGEFAYRNYNFDTFKPKTESQKEALRICKKFDPAKDNIYLVGPTGVGKSHLACSIALASMPRLLSAQRWKVTELLRQFRVFKGATEETEGIDSLSRCPLLILEDIGAQKETDWGNSILWEIIDNRIESGANGLIVTSNVGRSMLASSMGERIPSRLSSICRIVKVDGPDHRVTKENV